MSSTPVPPPERTSRYAVPLEELEGARISASSTVQEVGDPHRLLAPETGPSLGVAGDGCTGDAD